MKYQAILPLIAAAAFAAGLSGCARHSESAARPGQLTLGMVTDIGGLGDKSFNDSAYRGLLHAQRALGAHIQVLQSRSAADYQPNLTALTTGRFDVIYAIGNLMQDDLATVARQNPKQHYAIIDAVVPQPNVVSVTFKEEDGSFLAGALAALVSKHHNVAFLGGMDIPLIKKFEAGFRAGVEEINPKTSVEVKYAGSFDDVAAGKELANVLFDGGADIVYTAAGKVGLGAIDAVKSRPGSYIIGVDSNQDYLAPGKILTSVVKHVDTAVFDVARAYQQHHPLSGHIVLGLKDGGISLTDFQYTKQIIGVKNIARVDAIAAAIVAGKIVPPSTMQGLAAFKPVKI